MPPRSPKLSEDEIARRLSSVPGWSVQDGALHRELQFDDFAGAFAFMTAAAHIANELDHHPDWRNVYNRVTIRLDSHDVKGISDRDFALAERMNALL